MPIPPSKDRLSMFWILFCSPTAITRLLKDTKPFELPSSICSKRLFPGMSIALAAKSTESGNESETCVVVLSFTTVEL